MTLSMIKTTTRFDALVVPGIRYAPDRSERAARASTKRIFALAAMTAMLALLLQTATPRLAQSQGVELVKVDVALVDRGYRISKVMGQTVVNDKNEKIGTLDDIILGQDRRMYAVLQVGGFLGMGGRLVAVPYDSLKIADAGRKIELPGASKEELKKLTEFKYQG
jgi:hypothetical protein